MSENSEQTFQWLRSLGTVERISSAEVIAAAERPGVNSHVHLPPNFSAFDSVEEVVNTAAAQGIGVLGASNYYDYSVYRRFTAAARQKGIFPLFGLEITSMAEDLARDGVRVNDPGNPGRMYICGKGVTKFDPPPPEAMEILQTIRDNDRRRIRRIIGKVAEIFASGGVETGLDEGKIIEQLAVRHGCPVDTVYLQERHVARAFQEALFEKVEPSGRGAALEKILGVSCPDAADDAAAAQGLIRKHLMKAGKPAFVPEEFVNLEQARRMILSMGGIPCYPTLADGADPICPYEDPPEKLAENCRRKNIFCAELIPLRNSPAVLSKYVKTYDAAGIVVTAGTEHNTIEKVPLEPRCEGGSEIPQELKEIFWRGACVVAAHQFLVAGGQDGYVDANGDPNPKFENQSERIDYFAELGSALIGEYYRTHKRTAG